MTPTWRQNQLVQVGSFPGANFLHIARVLQKLSPINSTQKVILSVGLNNREQLFQQTAKKQLQEMWRAATTAFPNASIYTPVIHFSDRLPLPQLFICSNSKFLNEISPLRFKVEPQDRIHWTKETAIDIFTYWMDQLNCWALQGVRQNHLIAYLSIIYLTFPKHFLSQAHRRSCWAEACHSFQLHKTLHTKVFFKSTDTHSLLHKTSFHPKHTFKGIIKSQLIRFHRICSFDTHIEEACQTLFKVLCTRGYSKRFLRYIKSQVQKSFSSLSHDCDQTPNMSSL